MLKKLEINYEQHLELIKFANEQKIIFMSTGFDMKVIICLMLLNLNYLRFLLER